jgi:citrate synthase
MKQIDTLKKLLNKKLDEANEGIEKIHTFNNQLHKLDQKTNDMELGGVKIKDINKSIINLTKFLGGAFEEINKSVDKINKNLNKGKK